MFHYHVSRFDLAQKMSTADNKQKSIADLREAFRIIKEISELLNTGMEPEMLAICVKLIEQGANPDVLARIVQEMTAECNVLNSDNTS